MNKAAKIFLALGLDKTAKLRRTAAYIVGRFVYEFHTFGCFLDGVDWRLFKRVCKRFRVGDYAVALMAHYPIHFI